ncbi:hypothetical protein ACNOYE_03070 [Nannocystaceae bacterium ST9]
MGRVDDATLGNRWKRVFLLEVPICLATALFWLFAPFAALRSIHGLEHADAVHAGLLAQIAFVVLAMFVWFYARWLLGGPVALRPFRYLQEGMCLSDALLIWLALASVENGSMLLGPAIGQAGMAGLWLIVRVAFLVDTARAEEPAA